MNKQKGSGNMHGNLSETERLEVLWAGEFGTEYTRRNLFLKLLEQGDLIPELGWDRATYWLFAQ